MNRIEASIGFTPLIDWSRFQRRNLNLEMEIQGEGWAGFACGDREQAVAWLLRTGRLDRSGMLRRDADPARPAVALPGLAEGRYRITFWNTAEGRCAGCAETGGPVDGRLAIPLPPLVTDLAVAVRRSSR